MKTRKRTNKEIIESMANDILFWQKEYNYLCDVIIEHELSIPFKVSIKTVEEIIENYSYIDIE